MSLIVWGAANWLLEPKVCKQLCNPEETSERVEDELIPLLYDLTGIYIEGPSREDDEFTLAGLSVTLAYSFIFSLASIALSISTQIETTLADVTYVLDQNMGISFNKTPDSSDSTDTESTSTTSDSCIRFCELGRPFLTASAITTCAISFMYGEELYEHGDTEYLQSSFVCPVSDFGKST